MHDHGFDVPTMTEYQHYMDMLLGIFDEDVSFEEVHSIYLHDDVSTSNRDVIQELKQAVMLERKDNFTPENPSPRHEKRFNTEVKSNSKI